MREAKILGYEGRFPIVEVQRSSTGNHLEFKCPSCRRKVFHGAAGPKLGDGDGHRVPVGHGHGDRCEFDDGYILREVEHKVYSGRKRKGVGATRTRH